MRKAFFRTWLVLLATSKIGIAADQPANPPRALPRTVGAVSAVAWANGQHSPSEHRVRYRRLNGRWWYWLPSEQWAFWDGDQWTVLEPGVGGTANVASTASRAPNQ